MDPVKDYKESQEKDRLTRKRSHLSKDKEKGTITKGKVEPLVENGGGEYVLTEYKRNGPLLFDIPICADVPKVRVITHTKATKTLSRSQ